MRRLGGGLAAITAGAALLLATDGSPLWLVLRPVVVALLALGAWHLALAHRPAGAAVATVVGALVLPPAAVLAVAHATRHGSVAVTIAGLVAVVGSLAVLSWSVPALLAPVGWWRRLLAVPVAAVGVWALAVPLGVATYATNAPHARPDRLTPGDLGLRADELHLRTSDGVTLAAWYVPSRNGAAVVVLHGASSTRSDVLPAAAVLARHGYGVLLVDARGHGDSAGRPMELGW